MRLSAILFFPVMALANYPSQQSVLLDVNARSVTVSNSGAGGGSYIFGVNPGVGQRARVTLTPVNVPPALIETTISASITAGTRTVTPAIMTGASPLERITQGMMISVLTGASEVVQVLSVTATTFTAVFVNSHTGPVSIVGTTYTGCTSPCTLSVNRNWGQQYVISEIVDGSGNSLAPRKIGAMEPLAIVKPSPSTPGNWTWPIEVIGQDNFLKEVQATNSLGTTSNLALVMKLNHSACFIPPFDTKAGVQVNGGAVTANDGNWITVSNSTVTEYDNNQRYGSGTFNGAGGSGWNYVSGPIPQGVIGGPVDTVIVSVPIPNGLVTSGTNTFGFRSYCPDGNTSGYRILWFQLIDTSTTTQIDSISVTSNVATATAHSATTWATGDYWFFYQQPGMYARFNGHRQITKLTTTAATFVPCNLTVNTLLSTACTSPDGTYAAPTSSFPSVASAAQPAAYAVKEVLAEPLAVWDDPATWTSPGTGNAARGGQLWNGTAASPDTGALVNPGLPYLNYTIVAKCSKCHTVTGEDLKYFNYSNHAIEQRSYFHGLSSQDGLDIAAFIRGLTTGAPARVWTPMNQSAPSVDSQTIYNWGAGAGIDSVLSYCTDGKEYAEAGSFALWAPTARLNFHELPMCWQMPTWNQTLPQIYPQDYFSAAGFESNTLFTNYAGFRASVTPNNFSSYQSYSSSQGYEPVPYINVTSFSNPLLPSYISDTQPGSQPSSTFLTGYMGIVKWAATKTWELEHEFQLEQLCPNVYTATWGSASSPGYQDRCWSSNVPFNVGYHRALAGISGWTNPTNNSVLSWNYQTNSYYMWQGIINSGNLRLTNNFTMDIGYTYAFLQGAGTYFPGDYLSMILWSVTGLQSTWGQSLTGGNLLNTDTIVPGHLFFYQNRYLLTYGTPTDINNIYQQFGNVIYPAYIGITNTAGWAAWATATGQTACTTGAGAAWNGGTNWCDGIALAIPMLEKCFGASSANINTMQSWAQALWPAHNFATDRSATCDSAFDFHDGSPTWYKTSNVP